MIATKTGARMSSRWYVPDLDTYEAPTTDAYMVSDQVIEADLGAMRAAHEAKTAAGKPTPEALPTFNKPFEPIELDFSGVSDHWAAEVEAFKRKGPRWASPLYAKAMSVDTERAPDFHHKATAILTESGLSGPAIAKVLGVSLRSVRSYQSKPSATLAAEREEVAKRHRIEHHSRTKQGRAPFDAWAYFRGMDEPPPMITDLPGFDTRSSTRERVAFYLMEGGWSHADMARMLGISDRTVFEHVQKLEREAGRQRRRYCSRLNYKHAH